jgi:hypothetical protein
MRTGCRWSPARLSAWPPRAPELAPLANDRTPVSERPRAVRLLRQVAAAAILQADLEHPAPRGAARSDRLLDPAPLHPDRDCDLAPRRAAPSAESHRPGRRHSSGPRPGHARATSWFHPTRQARWAIAGHDQPARGRRIPSLRHRAHHELLETALCHGWVDTQTKRIDDQGYAIRFVPAARLELVGHQPRTSAAPPAPGSHDPRRRGCAPC